MVSLDATDANPQAVLWDMDGTLIDSEPYWVAAEIALVERFGGTWTHADGLKLVGQGLPFSALVLQRAGVDLAVDDIVTALTDHVMGLLTESVPWRPGAVSLMHAIAAEEIPQGLVTMSMNRMATLVADLIPGRPLSTVVSGDQVEKSKPDPESYLLGAKRLGVDIRSCVAFEDSPAGVASAHAAGAVTIGLPNLVDISETPADELWESLSEKSFDDIVHAYSRVSAARR
jgi:beta-phosphoglucomutase-like phosphatase (HAD superfamily)